MRNVAIIGVGMSRFGKQPERDMLDLAAEAAVSALHDSGLGPDGRGEIDAAYVSTWKGGSLIGQRALKEIGISGIPVLNLEGACAGGGIALAEACWSVASGRYDTVLALGVDKLTSLGSGVLPLSATDDPEIDQGVTMPAVYAMRAQRYLCENELEPESLARVSVKNRQHGALNPYAHFQEPVTLEQVLSSRMISTPLTLLQSCPTSDGAAAVLVAPLDESREGAIRVAASVTTSGRFTNGYRDQTWMEVSARASAELYEKSGIGPADVDMIELHDAFSIAEVLYYEVFGLADRGDGWRLLQDGGTSVGGRIPVNPSGGLMSRGHAVGATGLAQVCEVTWQLRGTCGERQIPGSPRVAMTHVTGGGIWGFDNGACAMSMLVRDR